MIAEDLGFRVKEKEEEAEMACEECIMSCQMAHWKKNDLSPTVYRFFKVLFGNDVSEVLCLPPKFARTISHMDGKETKLEDSTGAQWTVTLSNHEGILAFRNGWSKFAADHKLQIGEFLLVNYFKNGHFVVQIFEHSCSERTEFRYKILPEICNNNMTNEKIRYKILPEIRNNNMTNEEIASEPQPSQRNATNGESFKIFGHPYKKARVSRNIVKAYTSSETSDTSETNRDSSSPSDPVELNLETQSIHQPSSKKDDFLKPKSCYDEEQPYLDDACCVIIDRDSFYDETEKKNVLYDLSVFEMQKSECFDGKRCSDDDEEDTRTHAHENVASMAEARTGFIGKMPITKVPDTVHTMGAHNKIKSIKKELVTLREEESDRVQKLQDLKPSLIREVGSPSKSRFKRKAEELELDDSLDEPDSNPDSISCFAEADNHDFIVLPARLPGVKFKLGKGKMDHRCSILLQDPKKRKWPSIYYEKFGIFVLICGWKQFNQANKVRLGDRYKFSPKNESPYEYLVDVDHM